MSSAIQPTASTTPHSSGARGATDFTRFDLHPDLERGLERAGFTEARPIQIETLPAALEGEDVLGLAQTGTGKTAAFALPLLDQLLDERRPGPRALVLAPTRELATQIEAEIRTLAKFTSIRSTTIYGGVAVSGQRAELRKQPEIVVGCPGRVLDLLQQRILRLDRIETLVLDEADHMLDMGFLPDIRRILSSLPEDRQNLLFSATMPKPLRKLADEILHRPHVVELAHSAPAETIEHALYPVREHDKRALLDHILESDDCRSAIIFTRTKHRARRLADQLGKARHRAVALQGNMSQGQRDRAMRGFREGRFDLLVATDIAARGIDVSNVSYVINYDVPNTAEAYTHRIGRTGRSETSGRACTFVTAEDGAWVRATERMIGKRIPRCETPGFEGVRLESNAGERSGGRSGSRPGSRSGGRSASRSGGRTRGGGAGRSSARKRSKARGGRTGRAPAQRTS